MSNSIWFETVAKKDLKGHLQQTPLLGKYFKELKAGVQTKTCARVVIAILFTAAKRGTQSKCLPADGSTSKMFCSRTMEYHSAVQRNEALTPQNVGEP